MDGLKKHKNDILLILALLLLAGGLLLWQVLTRKVGGEAVVTVEGVELWRAPLSRDAMWDYEDAAGEAHNRVVIKDGTVCVESADCPDKVCVRTGRIRYDGESIICLPHKLIVTVTGAAGDLDAVAN